MRIFQIVDDQTKYFIFVLLRYGKRLGWLGRHIQHGGFYPRWNMPSDISYQRRFSQKSFKNYRLPDG